MRSAPRALACHVRVFHFRAPASPAQRILGGGFGRGAKPPSEWNVQRVRLACGRRAPPCSWTLLIALARAFLRPAPRCGHEHSRGGGPPHPHRPAPHPAGRIAPDPARRGDGAAGPERGGQDDDHAHDHGRAPSDPRRRALRRPPDPPPAALRDRAARHRLRARGAGHLRHPHRGREPARRRARRGRGERAAAQADPRPLPRSRPLPPRPRGHAVRRPEADALHRARLRQPEPAPPDRRAIQGAGAHHRPPPGRRAPRHEATRHRAPRGAELRHGERPRRRLLPDRRRAHGAPRVHGLARRRPRAEEEVPRHMKARAPLLVTLAVLLLPLVFMDLRTYLTLTVAGLAMGMLIFLVASGLTLIFGLMDVLNFAHGALFSWGAYAGFSA